VTDRFIPLSMEKKVTGDEFIRRISHVNIVFGVSGMSILEKICLLGCFAHKTWDQSLVYF